MGEDTKSILISGAEKPSMEQLVDLFKAACDAKEMLRDIDKFLYGIGVKLITATVAVQVKGLKYQKIFTISCDEFSDTQVMEFFKTMAEHAENSAKQSIVINEISRKLDQGDPVNNKALAHTAADCKVCPAQEICPERIQ